MRRCVVIAGVSQAAFNALLERSDAFVHPDELLIPACIGSPSMVTGQELAERAATRIFESLSFRSDIRYTEATIITLLFSTPPEIAISFRQWMAFAYTVEIRFDARLQKVSNSKALDLVRACQRALSQSRRAVNAIQ